MEKDSKKLQSEIKRLSALVRFYEKENDFSDRIVEVVRNAVETLPQIEPPKPHIYSNGKKEEVILLQISDVHVGKKTTSYNPKVFVKRLETLKQGLFDITDIHKAVRPIRKLVIAFCGDKQLCLLTPLIR